MGFTPGMIGTQHACSVSQMRVSLHVTSPYTIAQYKLGMCQTDISKLEMTSDVIRPTDTCTYHMRQSPTSLLQMTSCKQRSRILAVIRVHCIQVEYVITVLTYIVYTVCVYIQHVTLYIVHVH